MKRILAVALAAFMLMALLAGCGSEPEKKNDSGFNVNVYVTDESGKPVSGVKVQACDDSLCMVADTDAEGHAGFSMSKNTVDIHILKAPEGYAFDSEGTFNTDDGGSLTVTLKAA